jgi:hypothetical protein
MKTNCVASNTSQSFLILHPLSLNVHLFNHPCMFGCGKVVFQRRLPPASRGLRWRSRRVITSLHNAPMATGGNGCFFSRKLAIYAVKVWRIWKNAASAWICGLRLIMCWIMRSHKHVFLEGLYRRATTDTDHTTLAAMIVVTMDTGGYQGRPGN